MAGIVDETNAELFKTIRVEFSQEDKLDEKDDADEGIKIYNNVKWRKFVGSDTLLDGSDWGYCSKYAQAALSADHSRLLGLLESGIVRVSDCASAVTGTGAVPDEKEKHKHIEVNCYELSEIVACDNQAKQFAIGSVDGMVRLFAASEHKAEAGVHATESSCVIQTMRFQSFRFPIGSLKFHPSGTKLLSYDRGNKCCLWSTQKPRSAGNGKSTVIAANNCIRITQPLFEFSSSSSLPQSQVAKRK